MTGTGCLKVRPRNSSTLVAIGAIARVPMRRIAARAVREDEGGDNGERRGEGQTAEHREQMRQTAPAARRRPTGQQLDRWRVVGEAGAGRLLCGSPAPRYLARGRPRRGAGRVGGSRRGRRPGGAGPHGGAARSAAPGTDGDVGSAVRARHRLVPSSSARRALEVQVPAHEFGGFEHLLEGCRKCGRAVTPAAGRAERGYSTVRRSASRTRRVRPASSRSLICGAARSIVQNGPTPRRATVVGSRAATSALRGAGSSRASSPK